MSLALITWASSWIGKAMAMQLAETGHDLFLVARRKDVLDTLAKNLEEKYSIHVYVVAWDLTDATTIESIVQSLNDLNLEIDYLINNAWFGWLGRFVDQSLDKNLSMINLNIKAVVSLTHRLLPMIIKSKGKILNIWSTAWFMPWPLQATYFATKAFVNSWSQALRQELKPTWVSVTVLCPWATATEFANSADAESASMFQWSLETAESVARKWIQWMLKWKKVVVTDWKLWFMITFLLPILPRGIVLKMVEQLQK